MPKPLLDWMHSCNFKNTPENVLVFEKCTKLLFELDVHFEELSLSNKAAAQVLSLDTLGIDLPECVTNNGTKALIGLKVLTQIKYVTICSKIFSKITAGRKNFKKGNGILKLFLKVGKGKKLF